MKKLALCAVLMGGALLAHAQKTVITVAAYPAVDAIVKEALPAWQKLHPQVEVKVVSREYGDHHTAMTTALATSSSLPDVMAIEYGFLGRFAQGGGLQDLSKAPFNATEHKDKFVAYAYQQGFTPRNGQSALPTDIGPGSLFYRSDILQKAGLKEADLTTSWDSFVTSGQKIKSSTGAYLLAHARDIKDVIIRANVPDGDGVYFDSKGKAAVDSPRFKLAFEKAKAVRDAGLDAKITAWSNEWGESFKRGTVATQMMGAWLGGHLSNWLAPATKGMWRAAPLPQGVNAAWGGTFYAIPGRAANKDLAWDLIKHLTMSRDQQLAAFQKYDAFPALITAQSGNFFEQPIEFLGGQKARSLWRDSAGLIKATAVFRHDPIAEEIVNTELDLVLTRNKPIAEALKDAQAMVTRRASR
ncbi:MAG: extracellular solute-binding protein [Pseudomonadota bacterium]